MMTNPGYLRILGLGPGSEAWVTPEVTEQILQATHVIGYAPYLARLRPRVGQIFFPSDNRVELERARDALLLTEAGHKVAVVSGGDPGIFAMAAAIFEAIENGPIAWREMDVKICPGISAMQAAAARIGAPLGHDFCAISLSDNLKPWPLVARRLKAVAEADFVIALYNPASQARQTRIFEAFTLLREIKTGTTPIVFAKAIGRVDEKILIATLAEADPSLADMSTLVLIGSSETRMILREQHAPFVYTPRGARPA
jgi:precorrin-3B C17-methyltransferase